MKFENRYNLTSLNDSKIVQSKKLDILQNELQAIKDNITLIEEKQRLLANLSKLYN